MDKKTLEDFVERLERMEELADNLDVMAYHLRKDMEKELKQALKQNEGDIEDEEIRKTLVENCEKFDGGDKT